MQLIGTEVLPEVRAHAEELGLTSMLDVKPGSRTIDPGGQREPVVDLSALEAFTHA
jgi:hypothetical protein